MANLSSWQRFTRGECPICNGARRDCRQNSSTGLIHCRDTDANPGDYIFRGLDTLGFAMWAYKPDAENWNEEKQREWKEQRDRQKQAEKERHGRSLSRVERDREIRKILDQLTLSESDRAILSHRAYLTDERIENYRSVSQWQELTRPVSPRLAGTNHRGDKLNNPVGGILIPVPDENGLYVGLRLYNPHHKENNHGKYTPLSSVKRNVRPNLQNGENPIAVYWPEKLQRTDRIGLTESVEFKPAITADRLGIPVIGASGGNFASSPESLRSAIETVRERLGNPDASIVLYPDAGSLVNPTVTGQYKKLSALLPIEVAYWNHGFDKSEGDIDEIGNERIASIALLSPGEFFALAPEPKKKPGRIQKLLERAKRFKGFGKPPSIAPVKTIDFLPESTEQWESLGRPEYEYTGDPAKNWQELTAIGFAVHDGSFMGAGKSHGVVPLANSDGKIWYISSEHRNPSIEAIAENFTDLDPRSQHGFYRDENGKWKVATEDTDPDLIERDGNCIRVDLFHGLSAMGYSPNEKDGDLNPICRTCPVAGVCISQPGYYRHDRHETLKKDRIRESIESSPRDGYDYSPDILVIEESSRELKPIKTIDTSHEKLLIELDRLRPILSPEHFAYLDSLLQSLKPIYGEKTKYGHEDEHIREFLPIYDDIDSLIAFLDKVSIDLGEIFTEPERVVLTRAERKQFRGAIKTANAGLARENFRETMEKLENLPPNGLIYLLKFIRGDKGIVARVHGKKITVTIADRWFTPILDSARGVIFLDATATAGGLKLLSGIDRPIITVRKKIDRPLGNLTIHQIEVDGLGSNNVSDTAIGRVNAILGALKESEGEFPIICHKAYRDALNGAGHWFRDNRSSNDYQGTENLAFVGSPFPNIGAKRDEYRALAGTLDGFDDYYQDAIRSEQLQGIGGRQRCHRYPDKEFHVWAIGTNLDLGWLSEYGAKIEKRHGFEITPAAGDRFQFATWQIVETIRDCIDEGIRSGRAIAKRLGKSPDSINKQLRKSGFTLDELIHRYKVTTGPIKDSIGSVAGHDAILNDEWFRSLFRLDPITLAEEIITDVTYHGLEVYRREILPIFPEPLRLKIEATLIGFVAIDTGGAT
jgi:hypothetical protein